MPIIVREAFQYLINNGFMISFVAAIKMFQRKYENYEAEYHERLVKRTAESVGSDLSVNGRSHVNNKTALGNNVNFNGLSVRGRGSVKIGDNFHSGEDCMIITQNHNYDAGDAIPYDDTYDYKNVSIGDNVWLGSRVIILPGVSIEEGAIIQAGSTVTNNIPKGAIAGGHPAKVFGHRDLEHYEQLKSDGKFH